MGTGLHALAATLQAAGVPATAKTSANTSLTVTTGSVSLVTDIVTFPGPPTMGNWIVGNQRVLVFGVPTVGQTATGQATVPSPPSVVPMIVSSADSRASGS